MDTVLVLEMSASERLFGGYGVLLAQIFKPNGPLARGLYAQGATSLIAFGRLLCGAAGATGDANSIPLDALPLHTLSAARPHLPTLARLGLRNWRQLRALPRGGLARRFGAGLVDAVTGVVASPPAGPVVARVTVGVGARRTNAQHIDAHHSGGSQGRLVLRTADPTQDTQDMQHLQRLLGEQLARVTLPAPVLYLRLRSLQTQPLAGESQSLLPEDVRMGDSLHQLLERLSARLGAQQVLCATPQADHRPECMQRWMAAADSAWVKNAMKSGAVSVISTRASGLNDVKNTQDFTLYPAWLLAIPQRLAVHHGCPQYQGSLTLLAGPQRLESGWLDGDGDGGCALPPSLRHTERQTGICMVCFNRLLLWGGTHAAATRALRPCALVW